MHSLVVALLFCLGFAFAQVGVPPVFEDSVYGPYETLMDSQVVAGYTIELWQPATTDGLFGMAFKLISPAGEVIQFEDAMISFKLLDDVNQNGLPDVFVESFSGGAHCCTSSSIYELGDSAELIFDHPFSECGVILEDVNADGLQDLRSCDDVWAYLYCSYAESPLPSVVWQWDGTAYTLANTSLPQIYDAEISQALEHFLLLKTETADWTPTPECTGLALALPYLYKGQADLAYQALKLAYDPGQIQDDVYPCLYLCRGILGRYSAGF